MGIETGVLLAYAAAASAVVGAGSAIYSGDQQRKAGHRAEDQAAADAEAAQGAAQVEADKIRKATRARQSEAVASLAASGVDISSGTAEQIQTDIGQRGEEDALTTILTGGNRSRSLRQRGEEYGLQGENAQTAGYVNATSSVLSSVSSSARASGWRSTNTNYSDLSHTTRGSGD